MTITSNYLSIPYNPEATLKTLLFYAGGRLIFDMEERVDFRTPDRTVYFDCSRWKGQDIVIRCEAANNLICADCLRLKTQDGEPLIGQCDIVPKIPASAEKALPFVHYMRRRGLLCSPNGPVFFGGKYHVFFQTNPVSTEYRNMCWGHVCSEDLFRWETLPEVLCPNEDGEPFSGCAVTDGKKLMLFYTAAGGTTRLSKGKGYKLCCVESTDGLNFNSNKTILAFAGSAEFSRDPKIVFCEEEHVYLMLIYQDGSNYSLLSSEDLSLWQFEQLIELPGDSGSPDIYKLFANGDPHRPYWIISGASDRYLVGRFERMAGSDGQRSYRIVFKPDQRAGRLHFGTASYAGQSFFGTPEGDVKRFTWLSTSVPSSAYSSGQLSVPMQMSLATCEDRMYLCAQPVKEISRMYGRKQTFRDIPLLPENKRKILTTMFCTALDIDIFLPDIKSGTLEFTFFGIEFKIDFYRNTVECLGNTAPLHVRSGNTEIRLIIDRLSAELFIDGGKFYMSVPVVCDYNLDRFIIKADGPESLPGVTVCDLDPDGSMSIPEPESKEVTADDVARIVTNGYDLSDFKVIDDSDESIITEGMGVHNYHIHLGGRAHFTKDVGSMTLFFEGTAVGVLAETGGFDILIDEMLVETAWTASCGRPKVLYYTESLSNGVHTITVITNPELAIEKTEAPYSVLEGFFVQREPGVGSATGGDPSFDPAKKDIAEEERAKIYAGEFDLTGYRIVDDTAPGVVKRAIGITIDVTHINGAASFTDRAGSLSYSFEGNAVGVLAEKGGFEIEIDGIIAGRSSVSSVGAPQIVFFTSELDSGVHTIKVTTVPELAVECTGEPWSVLEGFFVRDLN